MFRFTISRNRDTLGGVFLTEMSSSLDDEYLCRKDSVVKAIVATQDKKAAVVDKELRPLRYVRHCSIWNAAVYATLICM